MQKKCITERFPEGESYEDVKNRIADFLEFLKQNFDEKNVAIVAHKAPQLALDGSIPIYIPIYTNFDIPSKLK